MSAVDFFRGWKENNPQIKNILLFVSDSLRWDYTPESVASQGVTLKTVASSIWTPASLASLATGLYPPHHGVHSFRDMLRRDAKSIFNLQGYNASIWNENTWVRFDPPEAAPLFRLLRHTNRVSLYELEPPFIYLENEKGGHCPYGWSFADEEYEEWDCLRFFRDYGKKEVELLRKRYQKGVERSVEEFDRRIGVIKERGLEDETLIVFLSDHGELLGEYGGIVGHGNLTAPEVVYVPTVFIHPDLPRGRSFEKEGVLRHVDLYPTICDILNKAVMNVNGISLLSTEKLPRFGYTYYVQGLESEGIMRLLKYELKETSVWDKSGGYLFREDAGLILRLLRAIYITGLRNGGIAVYQKQRLRRMKLPAFLKNYCRLLKYFGSASIKYGLPSFSFEEARHLIKKYCESYLRKRPSDLLTEEEKLLTREDEEKVKARLRALGYID